MRSRALRLLPVLVYGAVILLTYWRIWGPLAERRVFGWDCLEEYWPNLAFQVNSVRHWELPLWNPFDRMGIPFFADPQTGTYHPLTWLLGVAGLILGNVSATLLSWKILLHLIAGALGMHAFVRALGTPRGGAYVAGISFSLFGAIGFMKDSAVAWPWMFLPYGLLAVDACLAEPSVTRGVLLGGAVALAGLAGSPPGFFYVLLVLVAYALFRTASSRGRWRELGPCALVAMVTSAALLAIVYVPTAELTPLTERAARDLAYATSLGLPPQDLVGLVVPGIREPPSAIYAGFLPLLLAGLAVARPGPRKESLFFVGLAMFAIVLSLGETGGLLDKLAALLPGFSLFRVAERYKLLFGVALAALGALGLRALPEGDQGAPRTVLFAGVLVLVTLGVALVAGYNLSQAWPNGAAKALLMGGVAVALLGGLIRLRAAVPAALWAAVVVALVLDAWMAHGELYKIYEFPPKLANDADVVRRMPGAEREFRVFDEFQLEYRPGSRLRIREATGYGAMKLGRWSEVMERVDAEPKILAHFNVKWVLRGAHHRRGLGNHVLKRITLGDGYAATARPNLYEAKVVAPAVYWVGNPSLAQSGPEVLAKLAASVPGQSAVLDEHDLGKDTAAEVRHLTTALPPVAGRVTRFEANRFDADITAPASGLVVVNETYYPGWQARVDGRDTPILPVNHLVRGILVEPGAHHLELRFRPRSFRILGPLYLGGILAVIGAAVLELRRWRRRMRATSSSMGAA